MRATFGLVGLLVTLCVGLLFFYNYDAPVLHEGKRAENQARQISGRGADGAPASESVTLEPHEENGRLRSLEVTAVVPGGAMDQYYGLQQGDRITAISGLMSIGDLATNDGDLAKSLIADAYQKQQPLVIQRGSQQLTLPVGTGAVPPATQSSPSTPAADDQPALSPAEKLLHSVKIPTH